MYLNIWVTGGGAVSGGLRGVVLEEVYHWRWALELKAVRTRQQQVMDREGAHGALHTCAELLAVEEESLSSVPVLHW